MFFQRLNVSFSRSNFIGLPRFSQFIATRITFDQNLYQLIVIVTYKCRNSHDFILNRTEDFCIRKKKLLGIMARAIRSKLVEMNEKAKLPHPPPVVHMRFNFDDLLFIIATF